MKNDKNFEEIGKKIPYSVPNDFFENITLKTLGKAREEIRKLRIRKLVISVSVAATFLIVVSIGFSVLKKDNHKTEIEIVQTLKPEILENESQDKEIFQNEPEESLPEEESIAVQKENSEPSETIENLLTQMNDEELRELASILNEELFFDDLTIELQ